MGVPFFDVVSFLHLLSKLPTFTMDDRKTDSLSYDDALRVVGEFGRYQKFCCIIVGLGFILRSFAAFNMVFIAATPQHHCKLPIWVTQLNVTK